MLPFKITSDYGYIGRFGWINSVCDLRVKIHIGGNYEEEWIEEGLFTATFQFFGEFFIIPRMFSNPEEALQLKLEVAHAVSQVGEELEALL
jgi:hypothetical protein